MMTYQDRTDRFNSYDPNTSQMWGVYNGTQFKAYAKFGHAVNSFNYQYRARVFMMKGGRWVEVAIKTGATKGACEICGIEATNQKWRKVGGKHADPPQFGFVCANHYDMWVG